MDAELVPCGVCGKSVPESSAVPGDAVREALWPALRERSPEWQPQGFVCRECLDRARVQYIVDAISSDQGELSEIERDVVESLKNHELLVADLHDEFETPPSFGDRVADRVASFGGSWAFIGLFLGIMVCWIGINGFALLAHPFDPFPFILLNLVLSCLAAMQAPVIMMSQNRHAEKDRLQAEHDYKVNLKAELEIRHLHEKLDHLVMHQMQRLMEIQQLQIDMLEEFDAHLRGDSK
ncbi:MAG: DUF1003 domain-containing protein [Fimbriimonadaceae bacterium]|nr:DUF1003 domain-containing protein [Fimbriimonadaceae bacterium]